MAKKTVVQPPAKAQTKPAPPPAPTPVTAIARVSTALPDHMAAMLAEDAGSGLEGIGKDDLAIPRLVILQALSPQVNKREDSYIDGAEAGMILNTVSGELTDGGEGVKMLLVSYRKTHVHWWPRNSKSGKGFIADLGPDPTVLARTTRTDKGQNLLADGSEIVPTAEYFGFMLKDGGGFERVLISMSKTQITNSRKLNTLATSLEVTLPSGKRVRAPLYYRTYLFKTKPESNDQGSWFGWDITPAELVTEIENGQELYESARSFAHEVTAGKVKAAAPVVDEGGGKAVGDDAPM